MDILELKNTIAKNGKSSMGASNRRMEGTDERISEL